MDSYQDPNKQNHDLQSCYLCKDILTFSTKCKKCLKNCCANCLRNSEQCSNCTSAIVGENTQLPVDKNQLYHAPAQLNVAQPNWPCFICRQKPNCLCYSCKRDVCLKCVKSNNPFSCYGDGIHYLWRQKTRTTLRNV
jgi:hypothetical protein